VYLGTHFFYFWGMKNIERLQYPVGKFITPETISNDKLQEWITILEMFPAQLRDMVSEMSNTQLDTPYRPEGWTVRQVVHHVADSHHHSYIRFKWALTEDNPTIKPYLQDKWAAQPDLVGMPVEWSLRHIEAIHYKLVRMLKAITDEDLNRTFVHPDGNAVSSLRENVGRYAWHSMHHFMHIANLVKREGWE